MARKNYTCMLKTLRLCVVCILNVGIGTFSHTFRLALEFCRKENVL